MKRLTAVALVLTLSFPVTVAGAATSVQLNPLHSTAPAASSPRLSAKHPQAAQLATALRFSLAAARAAAAGSGAGLNAEFQIPPTLPAMTVDEPKFRQLFQLLFREALINLSRGNTLTMEATAVSGRRGACQRTMLVSPLRGRLLCAVSWVS